MPSIDEFAEHIVDQQLRCHGLVSLKGFTYLRRNTELRKAVKNLVNERLSQQVLEPIQLHNGEVFYLQTRILDQTQPRLNNRLHILSPFDNSVIQRDRLKTLFGFDYQIECYVPEAKRQFGYFSLPLLYRGEFIGRMDCKAHRKIRNLEIKFLHFEQHGFDEDELLAAFVEAIQPFCRFQQCDFVSLTKSHPKHLVQRLSRVLNSITINAL